MSGFHVGQKVCCIDDSPGDVKRFRQYRLEKGTVYTVSAIASHKGAPLIQVAELPVPENCYWRASRFRPVRTTSIEVFTDMLVPSQVPA